MFDNKIDRFLDDYFANEAHITSGLQDLNYPFTQFLEDNKKKQYQ
jgi:hypothetical protein